MGGSHSTQVDLVLQNVGINRIETGLSAEEAEKIWADFDTNNDGVLEVKEATKMFDQIGTLAIKSLQEQIDLLHKHLKDEEFIAGMLRHFDTNNDGKVTKDEFLARMAKGYLIGAEIDAVEKELDEEHKKDAAEVDKWAEEQNLGADREKPDGDEEEQPAVKKAKVDTDAAGTAE